VDCVEWRGEKKSRRETRLFNETFHAILKKFLSNPANAKFEHWNMASPIGYPSHSVMGHRLCRRILTTALIIFLFLVQLLEKKTSRPSTIHTT